MSTLDSILASELDGGTAGEEETVGLFSVEVDGRVLEVLVGGRNVALTPVPGFRGRQISKAYVAASETP